MTFSIPPRPGLSRQAFLRMGACAAGLTAAGATAGPAAALDAARTAPGGGRTVTAEIADGQDPRDSVDDLLRGTSSFPGNDGRRHAVTWDEHSFLIDDDHLLIYSSEIHSWRVPAPAQWRDLLQMVKATGYTAVSFYFFWGMHQTSPGGAFEIGRASCRERVDIGVADGSVE